MILATNLGLLGLRIIILSTVTTTFLDAYSVRVTFLNIFVKFDEKKVSFGMATTGLMLVI